MSNNIRIEFDSTSNKAHLFIDGNEVKNISALSMKDSVRSEGAQITAKMPKVILKKNDEGATRPAVIHQEYDLTKAEGINSLVQDDRYWKENAEQESDKKKSHKKTSSEASSTTPAASDTKA